MLSYRHGFHAGNHADVLKHIVLCLIIRSLKKKDKPFSYIDTHSGGGAYSLSSAWSTKTLEYKNGIEKIIGDSALKNLVPEYFDVINDINDHSGKLLNYPGSPYIAHFLSREQDDLNLIELHPSEYEILKQNMHYYNNIHVHHRSAEEGLNALLPPKIRRGLILVDPSYEMSSDYRDIVKLIKSSYKKFAQGIYAIWYPVLGKQVDESYNFIRNLAHIGIPGTLKIELGITSQNPEKGMNASGLVICNTPYNLKEQIDDILPLLVKDIGIDKNAYFKCQYLVDPN
ncbi:MAG: 23S rRNA (adenine(2030)-N(6))-methyltransferase RlmJ [Succinivibrionaceae bacterium]